METFFKQPVLNLIDGGDKNNLADNRGDKSVL